MRLHNLAVSMLMVGLVWVTKAQATILPPNNLHLQDTFEEANITQEQFNQIVDTIVDQWKPIAAKHGAKLEAVKEWEDSTVNAYAQQSGKLWRVTFFGGLARRPEVTPDGFALVVCHELGHHFAGHYFYGDNAWAASEGESDYWATRVCARRVWLNAFHKNVETSEAVSAEVQDACSSVWKTPQTLALCNRIADGGLSLARLLGALGGGAEPRVNTKDPNKVAKTNTAHPRAQCRLDTYISGALCAAKFDLGVIPGKGNASGGNSIAAEKEASKYSCMYSKGQDLGERPACWFRTQGSGLDQDDEDSNSGDEEMILSLASKS